VGDTDISHANIERLAACVNRTVRDMIGDETIVCEEAKALIALRAALDAAEANINVKADWIEATINDMAQGEQDAAEARAVGVKPLVWTKPQSADIWRCDSLCGLYRVFDIVAPPSWDFADTNGMVSHNVASRDAAFSAAQADYTARILSALHPASPLGAVPKWQPIETAPSGVARDGKKPMAWMLLAWPDGEGGYNSGSGMRAGDQFFAAATFYTGGPFDGKQFTMREIEVSPTHWMPMPIVEANAALAPFARKGE